MTTFGKIAIGIGAALGIITVVHVTVKATEKKYTSVNGTENTETEDKSFKDRIKEYVAKKTEQILGFAAKHFDEIKNATAIVGLAAGVFELIYRVKKLSDHDKILKDLNDVKLMICESASISAANYIGDDVLKNSAKHYLGVFTKAKDAGLI